MSVNDVTIRFQDRRDETPPKVVVIFDNFPDEITRANVDFLMRQAARKLGRHIQQSKSQITIGELKTALSEGLITQEAYDTLTQG